jgi:hypothetical protein
MITTNTQINITRSLRHAASTALTLIILGASAGIAAATPAQIGQVASLPTELEQLNPLDHPPAPGSLFSATSQPSMTLAGIDNWSPEQINPLDHPPAPASFLKLQPSRMVGLTTNTDNIQQLNPLDHPPAPNSLG